MTITKVYITSKKGLTRNEVTYLVSTTKCYPIYIRPIEQNWLVGIEFFNDKQNFPVKFVPDANAVINQLVANGRDKWMKVK